MPIDHSKYPQLSGELFEEVQTERIFQDQKTFVDATPRKHPRVIYENYLTSKTKPDFELSDFIEENFDTPTLESPDSNTDLPIEDYIRSLWPKLLIETPETGGSTLINLPNKHTAPSGRFREGYYWDTYFTAEGLAEHDEFEQIEQLLQNFSHLIEELGFIPNGNRVYYSTRSQPPYFYKLVQLYEDNGYEIDKYIHSVQKEYEFWTTTERAVRLPENMQLNRYWDEFTRPRPEGHKQDYELAQKVKPKDRPNLYRDIRAACESGWDFSSRWYDDPHDKTTIHTTELLPIDLNALLWEIERKLGDWTGNETYYQLAERRRDAINQYLWDGTYFTDYRFTNDEHNQYTLAGVTPLFTGLATEEQAESVAEIVEERFLHKGGVVPTTVETGEQWDYPNGWAPLTWITVVGLHNYGHTELANTIKNRWINLVETLYEERGELYEKYDVVANGPTYEKGEYPLQTGFGWTNGIHIALKHETYK